MASKISPDVLIEVFKFNERSTIDKLQLVNKNYYYLICQQRLALPLHQISLCLAQFQYEPLDIKLSYSFFKGNDKCSTKTITYEYPLRRSWMHNNNVFEGFSSINEWEVFIQNSIRNSRVKRVSVDIEDPHIPTMKFIKQLIDSQAEQNYNITSIHLEQTRGLDKDWDEDGTSLYRQISLDNLLAASFLSNKNPFNVHDSYIYTPIDKQISASYVLRNWNIGIASKKELIQHCYQEFSITWEFATNFPELFIEIFQQSHPRDGRWPSYITTYPFYGERPCVYDSKLCQMYLSMERNDNFLEYIWPNYRNYDLYRVNKHLFEVPHKRHEDQRILRIEFINDENRYGFGNHPPQTFYLTFETIPNT